MCIGLERYISRLRTEGRLAPALFNEERFFDVKEGDTFYKSLDHFPNAYSGMRERYKRARYHGDKIPALYRHYDQIFSDFLKQRSSSSAAQRWTWRSLTRRALDPNDGTWGCAARVDAAIKDWNEAHRMTVESIKKYPDRIICVNYERLFFQWSGVEELFAALGMKMVTPVERAVERLRNGVGRRAKPGPSSDAETHVKLTVEEVLSLWNNMDLNAWREVQQHCVNGAAEEVHPPSPAKSRALTQRPTAEPGGSAPKTEGKAQAEGGNVARDIPGKYQAKDQGFIDYGYVKLPGTTVRVRGPLPRAATGGRHPLHRLRRGRRKPSGDSCPGHTPSCLGSDWGETY